MKHTLPLGRPTCHLSLPGLQAPVACTTPAARRAWLRGLSDAALTDALFRWMEALATTDRTELAELARWLRAPLGEVVASPFGLRACALGANVGALVVHHEQRALSPWAADLVGDGATLDRDHGEWLRGALHAGRYQSFQLDGAFATFHPDHSARWTPHELLHRAVGYGWRVGMSRWETYLCARLAELLPVVHWYGPDLVSRLDEPGFTREADVLQPQAPLARAQWLHADPTVRRGHLSQTIGHLRDGLARFEAEFSACAEERTAGHPVAVAHALLDSRADATAYVAGHHPRLVAGRVTRLLDAGAPQPRSEHAGDLAEHVEGVFDALLFGPLNVDAATLCARAHGRLLWDVAHRAVHLSDWEPAPWLPALRAAWAAAATGDPAPAAAATRGLLADLPGHVRDAVAQVGLDHTALDPPGGIDRDQLMRGMESAAPATTAWLTEHDSGDGVIDALIAHRSRGPLAVRMAPSCRSDAIAAGLLTFEAALLGATRRDDTAERLGEPIDGLPDGGHLRASAAFTELALPFDAAELAESLVVGSPRPTTDAATAWLIGETGEGVAVIPCPAGLLVWWRRLPLPTREAVARLRDAESRSELGELDAVTWLRELSGARAITWLPQVG